MFEWNDTPGSAVEEALAVFDRAIETAKKIGLLMRPRSGTIGSDELVRCQC
jgi:hypothetical protein